MFPGQRPGEWEPNKIRRKSRAKTKEAPAASTTDGVATTSEPQNGVPANVSTDVAEGADVPMQDAPNGDEGGKGEELKKEGEGRVDEGEKNDRPEGATKGVENRMDEGEKDEKAEEAKEEIGDRADEGEKDKKAEEEDETSYEEEPTSTEGAVYPIQDGKIVNWPCFLAFLTHVNNILSPPFHTPLIMIAQPCWSARDKELLTQFCFETFKIPAFCLMDAALAACYAYGTPIALVVDVGYNKCDITAVNDFLICEIGRGTAIQGLGGEAITQRLLSLLEEQGFDRHMCEALKRSGICEVLPADVPMPAMPLESAEQEVGNPAVEASTTPATNGLSQGGEPKKMGALMMEGQSSAGEAPNGDEVERDGVLDVASIVATGNAGELLAKREKEREEKAATKKGGAGTDAVKPVKLKNSESPTASFTYEDYGPSDQHLTNGVSHEEAGPLRRRRREITVGTERFQAVSGPLTASTGKDRSSSGGEGLLESLAAAIHNTVLSVPEVSARSSLWENLIILGNGSRLKGMFIRFQRQTNGEGVSSLTSNVGNLL